MHSQNTIWVPVMILDVSLDNIVQFDDTSWSYFKCNHDILAQQMQKCNQCSGEPSSRIIVAKMGCQKCIIWTYWWNIYFKKIPDKSRAQTEPSDSCETKDAKCQSCWNPWNLFCAYFVVVFFCIFLVQSLQQSKHSNQNILPPVLVFYCHSVQSGASTDVQV